MDLKQPVCYWCDELKGLYDQYGDGYSLNWNPEGGGRAWLMGYEPMMPTDFDNRDLVTCFKFNYCPVCGRKFVTDEQEGRNGI